MMVLSAVLLATALGVARGQVLTCENNDALPGVEVCVKGTERCTFTDGSGNFEVPMPVDEPITLSVELSGFGRADVIFACVDGQVRRVLLDATWLIMECTYLGPPETMKYVAEGKIVAGARPVAGATILLKTLTGKQYWRGKSDRHGMFVATGFPEGNYVLEVRKRGYEAQHLTFRLQYCWSHRELTIPLAKACR